MVPIISYKHYRVTLDNLYLMHVLGSDRDDALREAKILVRRGAFCEEAIDKIEVQLDA